MSLQKDHWFHTYACAWHIHNLCRRRHASYQSMLMRQMDFNIITHLQFIFAIVAKWRAILQAVSTRQLLSFSRICGGDARRLKVSKVYPYLTKSHWCDFVQDSICLFHCSVLWISQGLFNICYNHRGLSVSYSNRLRWGWHQRRT